MTHRPRALASRVGRLLRAGGLLVVLSVLPHEDTRAQARVNDTPAALRRDIERLLSRRPESAAPRLAADSTLADVWRRLAEAFERDRLADSAMMAWRASLSFAEAVADSSTLSNAHNSLGLLHWTASAYDSALTHLRVAREIRRALGDRVGLGRTLNSIGATHYQLGLYEPALEAFVQAREIWRTERDELGQVRVQTNIGKTYHDWRQYDRARPVLQEAVTLARAYGDSATLGYALNTLAELQLDMGELDSALATLQASQAAYSARTVITSDSISGWSLNAMTLGRLRLREGQPGAARALFQQVLAVATERSSVRGQARALLLLGDAELALGEHATARTRLTESLALSRGVEQRVLALEAIEQLATLEEAVGRSALALQHWRASQALRDTIFSQASAQRIASVESRIATERQREENARLREEQRVQGLVIARQRQANLLGSVILALAGLLVALLVHYNQRGRLREAALARANTDLADANEGLRTALAEVRTLKGLIPICSSCKQLRDDDGYWKSVEAYLTSRSDATFCHGICQSCGPRLYGAHWEAAVADAEEHGR